jgi:DNA-directed RNA polymerase subunit F
MKIILTESQIKKLHRIINEDKTLDMGGFELEMEPFSQRYTAEISNISKKVIDYSSDFKPISQEEIQKLVDKLIHHQMITLLGKITDTTNVSILIWEIEDDSGLYIETYHEGEDKYDDMSDYNATMRYSDFLNL